MTPTAEILILRQPIAIADLKRLVESVFKDMVKYVVDVERGVIAIGGELHADAEEVLLQDGSRPGAVWGANYRPGQGPDECIEYTSLINIRPAVGNHSMELIDPVLRERVRERTHALIGRGEALP